MSWIVVVLKLIPTITRLMAVAEQAFDGEPDSGAQKKAYVMEGLKAIVEGLSGFTGSEELWAKVETVISPLIDIACLVLFKKDKK